MARKRRRSWWAPLRPKGTPLCGACKGTGLVPDTRIIFRSCRGWGC
jgi:hypothetical protein